MHAYCYYIHYILIFMPTFIFNYIIKSTYHNMCGHLNFRTIWGSSKNTIYSPIVLLYSPLYGPIFFQNEHKKGLQISKSLIKLIILNALPPKTVLFKSLFVTFIIEVIASHDKFQQVLKRKINSLLSKSLICGGLYISPYVYMW